VLAWLTQKEEKRKKEERSQKIDDLPVSVTCRFGTLAMLSKEVNVPVAKHSVMPDVTYGGL